MAHILVVDDLPFNVEFLIEELHLLNHTTESAGDGEEAIAKIRAHPPDLVLLDYSMPKKDGVEVLQALRADPDFEGLPVIMLTAKKEYEDRIQGLDAGADDYITKPFHIGEVAARINALLRLKDLQNQVLDREKKLAQVRGVGQTLVTLAHHINNATQALSGMAQLCQHAPDDLDQHRNLANIAFIQSLKISAVIDSLQDMVDHVDLKTADYAGDPEKMFDIEEALKERLKTIEEEHRP